MGGNIDCYLDIASPYSYITLLYLRKHRDILTSHGVTINLIPFFLGGVNVGSGNKPPWTLPAKATYGKFDFERAQKYHNVTNIETPSFFPPLTILPQRATCFIKATYPTEVFEAAWLAIYQGLWIPPQKNVSEPGALKEVLGSSKLFTEQQVEEIMRKAGEQEWKDALTGNTKRALELGAFGAPWMMVTNAKGETEPFFGSDRWHFIWEILGLPWQDITLLPKGAKAGGAKL